MTSRTIWRKSISEWRKSISEPDLPSEEYERLALEMLAVQTGDFADVKEAMRKIIASAPEGADTAFLLSRALAHAGDRALKGDEGPHLWGAQSVPLGQGSIPVRSDHHEALSLWWVAAAAPLLALAGTFWCLGKAALKADDGTGAVGVAAISFLLISFGFLGAALIGLETGLLLCWHARTREVAVSSSFVDPPGWYEDPFGQVTSRWWDGTHWTGRLKP